MSTSAPICTRRPYYVRLAHALVFLTAMVAALYALRPWLGSAQAVSVCVTLFVLLAIHHYGQHTASLSGVLSVQRIAPGHWRIVQADGTLSHGQVRRVWRAWGWLTLQLDTDTVPEHQVVTVWRTAVSSDEWRMLCVWATWECAMSRRLGKGAGL